MTNDPKPRKATKVETAIIETLDETTVDPSDNYCPVESLFELMKEKGYRRSATSSCLARLVREGKIIERRNPHMGDEYVAIAERQQPLDDAYDDLRDRTLALARERGFTPKWREGHGWSLFDENDSEVAVGPMWRIAEFLETGRE